MPTLKYYDGSDWQYAAIGKIGPTGPTGVAVGLPTGGATGASLIKSSSTDYATEWSSNVGGLVLINTTAFTAGVQHIFNDVFSSSYKNYFVAITAKANTTGVNMDLRLSTGGTPATTLYYYNSIRMNYNASTVNGSNLSNGAFWRTLNDLGTNQAVNYFYIGSPFESERTSFSSILNSTSETVPGLTFGSGYHNASTSYDGLVLLTQSANTLAGTLRIYGLKD